MSRFRVCIWDIIHQKTLVPGFFKFQSDQLAEPFFCKQFFGKKSQICRSTTEFQISNIQTFFCASCGSNQKNFYLLCRVIVTFHFFLLSFGDLYLKSDCDQFEEVSFADLLLVTRKKNYLYWRKHAFFEKNFFAIFSPKSKL